MSATSGQRGNFPIRPQYRKLKTMPRAPACSVAREAEDGAGDGIRARNRLFTKQVLYH